ncbi:hypothetical protein X808_7760 [Mannheimia varigena USDA-ARS-USMARC-1296]|uniref:Lipoprotein n=1 Tax=Mannheimia varigena USDA-ARS-USMARC-1296 TaxID=1433287 RepID=W0Q8V3_9PAST|nr:hypothetical protein [Mannheimia varigena]AHG75299.1 hypothetical protein X808_7760 [Mannheimia varigena USDA-ARS-USMARC-1296]
MKIAKLGLTLSLSFILTACALTPEQQAERRAKQVRAEQDLQVQLAKQCDIEAAELMHQQFNPPLSQTKKEEAVFKKRYAEKVSDPMFQACYKMAWQNYKSQLEIEEIRWNYERDHRYRGWHYCYYCW